MFEKEAEEIMNNHCDCESEMLSECLAGIRTRCTDFEEGKKLLLEGIEFGYNKANEWHYCKDELPDHNGQFYVALKGQTETFILNYNYDEYDESKMVWLDDDDTNFDNEVYAWHEKLKAPKESE